MRHTVKLHGVIVGHSDLEEADPVLGSASGVFRPGLGYDLVQPIFQLFRDAVPVRGAEPMDEITLERYYSARDKLGLELVDANGRPIQASVIHIADYSDQGSLRLEVLIGDAAYWEGRV